MHLNKRKLLASMAGFAVALAGPALGARRSACGSREQHRRSIDALTPRRRRHVI